MFGRWICQKRVLIYLILLDKFWKLLVRKQLYRSLKVLQVLIICTLIANLQVQHFKWQFLKKCLEEHSTDQEFLLIKDLLFWLKNSWIFKDSLLIHILESILKKWFKQVYQLLIVWTQLLEDRRFHYSLLMVYLIMK